MGERAPAAGSGRLDLAGRLPFFYGWVVVAVAVAGMFSSGPGQASILSVFIEPIGRETGWSRTVISGALSVATLTTALAMPLTGYIFDRYGARYLIAGTGLLLGLACLAVSRMGTILEMYLTLAVVRTLGLGVLSLACTTLVAQWFVRRRGLAMSLAVIGMALGLAAFPPVLQRIVDGPGWRTAWVAMAIVAWLLLIAPVLILVRTRPEEMGLAPDGDPPPAGLTRVGSASSGQIPAAGPVAPSPALIPALAPAGRRVGDLIRERTFWLLLLATATPFFVNVAVTFHQVPFLIDNGLSPSEAAWTVSFYALCFSGGSLIAGWLADRFQPRSGLIGTLLLLSISIVVLMNARTVLGAAAYGITFGLAAGANSTIERVIWPTYYGRANLGRINGVVMLIRMGFASAGPVLAGAAYDSLGSYGPFFLAMIAVPIVCALTALLVGPPPDPASAPGRT